MAYWLGAQGSGGGGAAAGLAAVWAAVWGRAAWWVASARMAASTAVRLIVIVCAPRTALRPMAEDHDPPVEESRRPDLTSGANTAAFRPLRMLKSPIIIEPMERRWRRLLGWGLAGALVLLIVVLADWNSLVVRLGENGDRSSISGCFSRVE